MDNISAAHLLELYYPFGYMRVSSPHCCCRSHLPNVSMREPKLREERVIVAVGAQERSILHCCRRRFYRCRNLVVFFAPFNFKDADLRFQRCYSVANKSVNLSVGVELVDCCRCRTLGSSSNRYPVNVLLQLLVCIPKLNVCCLQLRMACFDLSAPSS